MAGVDLLWKTSERRDVSCLIWWLVSRVGSSDGELALILGCKHDWQVWCDFLFSRFDFKSYGKSTFEGTLRSSF